MVIVIFRSRLKGGDELAYQEMLGKMVARVQASPGYISHKGYVSEDGERVTIVRFKSDEDALAWKNDPEHQVAQKLGRERWYEWFHVEVAKLEREYKFEAI